MRSREFDTEKVLDQAMNLFWEKGYENTSLKELMEVTGLHKGSLYAAFGSKEKLFIRSLERYGVNARKEFIKNECPLEYLKNFFSRLSNEGKSKKACRGCMIMNSNLEFGFQDNQSAKISKALFSEVEKNMKQVIKRASELNAVPLGVDLEELHSRLIGAAFSIRELSKFKNDEKLFKSIANGVLKELDLAI